MNATVIVGVILALLLVGLLLRLLTQSAQNQTKGQVLESQMNELRRDLLSLSSTQAQSAAKMESLAGTVATRLEAVSAAVQKGYVWLVIIAALNSTVSIYYYAGVLVQMYMGEGTRDVQGVAHRPYLLATLLITSVGTVALGLFPSWALALARSAMASLS